MAVARTLEQFQARGYTVLTVQSCRRGLPLVPTDATMEAATVSISAGKSAGLEHWTRFSPDMAPHGGEGSRFCVSDYVRTFASRLGLELAACNSMDGQRLVPYQCVVDRKGTIAKTRKEWEAVKDRFVEAFLLQKKAYRRANGGSTAPSFHADVQPRVLDVAAVEPKSLKAPSHRVVVRRTFLEVEEEEEMMVARQVRRPKTTGIVEFAVLAF